VTLKMVDDPTSLWRIANCSSGLGARPLLGVRRTPYNGSLILYDYTA
jgi:hypothetical protein